MQRKYFWNKKWFWISLTSLATIGVATFSVITQNGKSLTTHNWNKAMFADSAVPAPDVKTLSGYGYHGPTTTTYVPWTETTSKKIIDVFPTVTIANEVLNALKIANSTTFPNSSTISSLVSKADLASVTSLDLSNLNLNNIDEILNPAITWTKLASINLSNNNFGDYVLKFTKTQMPKLYSITARNANLQEMVDVSSYVDDPFDQTTAGSDERTRAEKQYSKALTTGVPRYFDLFQNQIPQIPKYYLKIALAHLDLSSNKLGTGTRADPQGVYAIPWYSMKVSSNTNTIGIPDADSRGPYGINLYNTGEKKASGDYTYSDEVVARWRAEPFPIKGLRFENYNSTISASGTADAGINFPESDDNPATGGSDPYFNFSNNSLVNIPIFSQKNVNYNSRSLTAPQSKAATVFVGLEDFKTSKVYTSATASPKPEMYTPQPDMIYPIISNWSWNGTAQSNQTWFAQGMQGLYYPRSFNGINQFAITSDSRSTNSQWDNSVSGLSAMSGGGVSWSLPTLPATNWANLFSTNPAFFGKSDGNLTFSTTSDNNYYKKWAALRTFPLSAKTFAKKSYNEAWDGKSEVDSNLYYDNAAWTGASTSDTTTPNNRIGQNWFFQTQVGHNTSSFRVKTGSARQFSATPGPSLDSYILGISQAAYFSNISNASDYGTSMATTTPFTQGLTIAAPRYNYRTNYQVVDQIQSSLDKVASFPTTLDATGFDLSKYKKDNQPVFARNITANDIKNGVDVFWKSANQFDQAYMKTLDPTKIKMEWDDAAGTLKYSFPVYSPGYSTLGRLFQKGDSAATPSNNATPTIDFEVSNTITGFAKTNLKMKGPTGDNFSDVNPDSATNHVLSQKAPAAFLTWVSNNPISNITDQGVLNNVKTELAKNFQTNYLGNNATALEGSESLLNANNIDITNIDNSNGTINFKITIPDHVFSNGNRLVFPQAYKDLSFNWTGLPTPTLVIVGTNLSHTTAPGLSFSEFKLSSYSQFITKAASQITINDIVSANVITSTRGDWTAIKTDSSNWSNYFELNPSDVNGTLTWTLKLPGDTSLRNQGLLPLTIVLQWTGFTHQNTSIAWKNDATLKPLGLGKTPNQLLTDIQSNPGNYLDITNGRETGSAPFMTSDFDFTKMMSSSVINAEQGTVQVSGISLKSYYKNGVWINNTTAPTSGATPVYLPVPRITLQAQIPYSVATFLPAEATGSTPAEGNTAIWSSITPFYQKSLYDDSSETKEQLAKKLSTSEIKQLLVQNQLSPLDNVLSLTTSPATSAIARSNLHYKNNKLKDSIVADPLNGTLTFQGLTVNNWINRGSNAPTNNHPLNNQTYTFSKLTNTWKWASQIPLAVSSLSFNTILSELQNPTNANGLMNHFNVGQKYYDNDGILKNTYTVKPELIELDPYLGTLTFKSGAIQVTNWVTNGAVATTPHTVTETKVYTFTNKLQTQYQVNASLTQGVNSYIANWVTTVKNDSYTNATAEKKAKYLAEFNQIQAPNYTNVDVQQGLKLTQQYLVTHALKKINAADKAVIDGLKASNGLTDMNFDDYFYVPAYLLFLSSPVTNATTSGNRTFAIAESVSDTELSNTTMQLNNVYIINYYNFPGAAIKSIQKISDPLFTGFLRAVSQVTFKQDVTNTNSNQLPTAWDALTPSQIKERLDYLTTNRNNSAITGGVYWQAIQQEWLSTFTFKNIPYNGVQDPTIVYPLDVVVSDYQRKVVVNQLLFPYYSQTATASNASVISLNQIINNEQVWLTKAGIDSFITQVANLKDDRFQKIPSTLLQNLGLSQGNQDDGNATWNKLVTEGIFVLNGNLPPITNLESNAGVTPSVSVGKISVDDAKGTITFENVVGSNVWVNGQQMATKTFNNLVLDLGLQSTSLVKNSNHVISSWLVSVTNETSIATSLLNFNQKLISGEFSLEQFNLMLNNSNAFFNISNPAEDPETKLQVAPNVQLSEVFHLNMTTGEITFKNLQIIKGYLNNVKVPIRNVTENLTFNLGWDYSTSFNQQFATLLSQKQLLNSNTDHAAAVLNQDQPQLLQYLNVHELEGQLETPSVSVSSNSVLGKLTFNVKFQNYYQNGINVGAREFSYTFSDFQQTLPAILGGIGAGLAVILIALIGWYIHNYIKNKDQLMIKTTNKKKQD